MESVGLITKQKEPIKDPYIPHIPERPSALTDMMDEYIQSPKGKIGRVWSASFLEHSAEDWLNLLESE